jgi:hypothetical protein
MLRANAGTTGRTERLQPFQHHPHSVIADVALVAVSQDVLQLSSSKHLSFTALPEHLELIVGAQRAQSPISRRRPSALQWY